MLAKPFYRLRAMNVFRDETSLAQTNKIGQSLREHLHRSDYLLVIASPTSAAAEWVREETQQWVQMGRLDRLIIIHVDGHIRWDVNARRFDPATACLTPAVLDADWTDQPFIIDLRGISRDELVLRNPAFAMAMAKIAARIRGVEPYMLTSEDVTQQRRTMFAAWGAGLSIVVLAGVVSALYGGRAVVPQECRASPRRLTCVSVARVRGTSALGVGEVESCRVEQPHPRTLATNWNRCNAFLPRTGGYGSSL
jgi:hypothetical protein